MKMRMCFWSRDTRRFFTVWVLICLLVSTGCTTSWTNTGSFYRATQTIADIESSPTGSVTIDNKDIGHTPVEVPLQYEQEVIRKERKVSYWITQPGWSLFMTICSLGTYLPISLIPVADQSRYDAQQKFQGNEFNISVYAPGHAVWRQVLCLQGEERVTVKAKPRKAGAAEQNVTSSEDAR